ncbi:MAG: TIGR03960 family B12-binding radical SAM protein [Oscillospiraceae bacterium]|nr:TIGR03960 family B12-binding radical SAM protein [Oscillospiraceae bacterium]
MKNKLKKILPTVEKPTRYIGNEYNSVHKDLKNINIRFAFCFPDVYEVGMSHLGMKILYHLLNNEEDIYCERVFAPWVDMEEKMRENNIPLFSLETMSPVADFDFIGFTLQYEMSYSNIVNMLKLAFVAPLSSERGEGDPFVCFGGPCAYSAEAIADFADFYMLGEGEEVMIEVMNVYREWKKKGGTRFEFLKEISQIKGIYVPSFYDISYNDDGKVKSIDTKYDFVPKTVKKRIIADMDKVFYPDRIIVPFGEIVHDRIMLEMFRGCIRGCRFCQAGMIYRPVREKSKETLIKQATALLKNTGYEEISLSSLSTSDYRDLKDFTTELIEITEKNKVNLSLPSLRLDSFSFDLMEKVQKVRKTSLTFAPEAGSQRMRDVINKGICEEDLLSAAKMAFEGGYTSVKLYFMLGLPYETIEDVCAIAELGNKVLGEYFAIEKEKRPKGLRLTISVSSFVPKAFTPFQWVEQNTLLQIREKQEALKKCMPKRINFSYHEAPVSVLEGVFARGDRRLSKVILKAVEKGVKFDGWAEHFRKDLWEEAFEECGLDPSFYVRKRDFDELLPWDMIDVGVSKKFLISEAKKAKEGIVTPNCRAKCALCGAASFGGGVCFE